LLSVRRFAPAFAIDNGEISPSDCPHRHAVTAIRLFSEVNPLKPRDAGAFRRSNRHSAVSPAAYSRPNSPRNPGQSPRIKICDGFPVIANIRENGDVFGRQISPRKARDFT